MHAWPVVLIAPLLVAAAPEPRVSWGKPGVALETYRADANLCASRGWNADVEGTEAVTVFRDGTAQIENLIGSTGSANATSNPDSTEPDPIILNRQNQIARIVETSRPQEHFDEVRAVQFGALEHCLADRGYRRFQLTDAQRKRLGKLRRGSPARHAYLHALASDAAVLDAQPVAAVSPR